MQCSHHARSDLLISFWPHAWQQCSIVAAWLFMHINTHPKLYNIQSGYEQRQGCELLLCLLHCLVVSSALPCDLCCALGVYDVAMQS